MNFELIFGTSRSTETFIGTNTFKFKWFRTKMPHLRINPKIPLTIIVQMAKWITFYGMRTSLPFPFFPWTIHFMHIQFFFFYQIWLKTNYEIICYLWIFHFISCINLSLPSSLLAWNTIQKKKTEINIFNIT